jgi:hypothetical protein
MNTTEGIIINGLVKKLKDKLQHKPQQPKQKQHARHPQRMKQEHLRLMTLMQQVRGRVVQLGVGLVVESLGVLDGPSDPSGRSARDVLAAVKFS